MDPKVVWLFVFVALYWTYCVFWGIKGALSAKTASDYFVAGRQISLWVFILAATATSFSGWTFMGHPGLIYSDGFQYAYASFYAITIPFTGVLFLKRQWMLGKRFGFITPGEMMAYYFRSDTIRILVVLVALVFSIPYLGVQLRASGFLFNVLTDNMLGVEVGMWLLSLVVIVYVASGGLRAVAYVDSAQAILLAIGMVVIGIITMGAIGGFDQLSRGIAALTAVDPTTGRALFGATTPDGHSAYIAIPGVIQYSAGLGSDSEPSGGIWTGVMILTYMFALMGVQSAPAFSMWAFGNKSPEPFAPQQVWASAAGIGAILMVFAAIQGIGSHFLGADSAFLAAHPDLVNPVMLDGLHKIGATDLLAHPSTSDMLVPQLIYLMSENAPWLVGLLSVCALAAMQSTGAAYMSTAGGMLTRDIIKRYLMPRATHVQQKTFGRIGVVVIVFIALLVASAANDALVLLGGLAVAYGFQMWPALIAVTLTENIGAQFMPWGRWPLTIHSAGWGIVFNLTLAILVSALTQDRGERKHRMTFHQFLGEHARLPRAKRRLIPVAWLIALAWFLFGIGPGAVIGNWIFGDPNQPASWLFAIPSIWAWQILWWLLGIGMMWFLAYKMELSTIPQKEVEALQEDIGDIHLDFDRPG
ncbi:MAG: sodium:solute symporter [Candidatus Sedimenticola endophacoides]|uniref:Sodium:solute symporter n=1 Tax=Candidatus Sedimenticola endophacoides TaxID=2548426 RepID=A0A657PRP6_9GAMM|nr:MAG: sodium:solute symporter [Candidatus Sedimenticola endophacoides]OQX33183.1 MAG: sodium:solute symporter [Candidatus Sedimenticola endophacoides]OQX42485.1 MAG: sodium:solute symporter [Candidatus Sedimenticola endophacoides]OQX44548.1 MAG: sodium:solute symporter [Candidatus Sedimenticola endophacoides]OQX45995.1 MAG: sodium:solute symporter [Candidatus Sedimenticola endophacoides]